ncbi:DExH-box ATP-dependent RNA helicase DExH6 [Hirschfeldia incana]|nr:DExH-box ATP-dependent RNA helicase DExH6 [Hirschfeldia incana]
MGNNKRRLRSENAAGSKPPSVEATRIWASKVIEDFRSSSNQVYTFEHNLSNSERKVIHQMCRKMGIQSKSSGRGDQRRLSIYKGSHKNGWNKEAKWRSNREKLRCVSFPPGADSILQDLFTHYPPCDGDTAATSFNKYVGRSGKQGQWRDDFFRKPLISCDEIVAKVASLCSRLKKDKALQEISKLRSKLPITSFRETITSAVESNQVILISGETGCGKTTQVPQYLLDHMWSTKRESCKIVCTQPRRISAMSVSERISCERGESIGDNIGYKVRLQSKGGRHSSVVFCTNGILLRVLVGKGSVSYVSDITHIIVDEIHERDCYSDFMLAIIRDLLPSNPHLRLILMSATLDAERFSGYFGGCPVVRVPGFTHPVNFSISSSLFLKPGSYVVLNSYLLALCLQVRTLYLEDVLSILKSGGDNHLSSANLNRPDQKLDLTDEDKLALHEAIVLAWTNDEFDTLLDLVSSQGSPQIYNYQDQSTRLTPLMVFAAKGRISDVCRLLSFGADWKLKSKDGMTASDLAEAENQLEAAQIIREHAENSQSNSQQAEQLLDKYMATINPEQVDVSLILQLVRKICSDSEDGGAILVFLPGWDDINKTRQRLLDSPFFKDGSKFDIICLHSMVPAGEQKKVFSRPPRGCRKIVLATNIAESAVTIDDVVYVIDSGRMKEKSYDPYSNVSTLQSSWVSKANAKQREGRAGRCQPGICYHLYSRLRAASMPEFKVPEIKRMPVEELCLQVKILDPNCKTNDFLQKLLDPPVDQSIANALSILKDIGALTPEEELTELGEKFGHLPVHPLISKMLFFAVLVNCLDPALTLACAADYKEPFTMPMSPVERQKAAAAKLELASLCGGDSDHLAVVAAFECWKNAKERGLAAEFCSQYFVSPSAMKMLDQMRSQLESELKRHGIIPSDISSCSQNSRDPGILRAVLAVGLYPMVGRLCPSFGNNRRSLVETASGAKVRVHSLSNNFNLSSKKYDESVVVFDEITRGDGGMHIRNCTVARDLPLLLISTEIAVAPTESSDADDSEEEEVDEETGEEEEGDSSNEDRISINKAESRRGDKMMSSPENSVKLVVDRWLPFKTTALEVAQMYILRERLTASILFKVSFIIRYAPHLNFFCYLI